MIGYGNIFLRKSDQQIDLTFNIVTQSMSVCSPCFLETDLQSDKVEFACIGF